MRTSKPDAKIACVLFLASAFGLYGQTSDPRAPAKAAVRLEASATYTLPPPTAVGTFKVFDVPGAVNGTFPSAVNSHGVIVGSYSDNVGSHGFIRKHDGTFVTFDVPGAVNGTFPSAVNKDDVVAGSYGDNIGSGDHAFILKRDGTVVKFDVPGASYSLTVKGINGEEAAIGFSFDVNSVPHSFLRSRDGAVLTFDPPGSTKGSIATAFTEHETILGVSDPFGVASGYARDPSGAFTEILGPDGLTGQYDIYSLFSGAALSANRRHEIAGTYFLQGIYQVFLLSEDGQYTAFVAANYPPCCIYSSPSSINSEGTVTGFLNDGFGIYRGFLRTRDGDVGFFDAPGAGTGSYQGTIPIGITAFGEIAGVYVGPKDGNFLGPHSGHGFVFVPEDH